MEIIIIQKKVISAQNLYCGRKLYQKKVENNFVTLFSKNVVLYGSKTWQLKTQIEKKLLALEIDIGRKSSRTPRTVHITNERVNKIMNTEETIIKEIA